MTTTGYAGGCVFLCIFFCQLCDKITVSFVEPAHIVRSAIEAAGFPGAVSNTAGTFVCNDTLYTLLHHYRDSSVKVGFIHVPQLPQQGSPSLPLEDTLRAVTAAIQLI